MKTTPKTMSREEMSYQMDLWRREQRRAAEVGNDSRAAYCAEQADVLHAKLWEGLP